MQLNHRIPHSSCPSYFNQHWNVNILTWILWMGEASSRQKREDVSHPRIWILNISHYYISGPVYCINPGNHECQHASIHWKAGVNSAAVSCSVYIECSFMWPCVCMLNSWSLNEGHQKIGLSKFISLAGLWLHSFDERSLRFQTCWVPNPTTFHWRYKDIIHLLPSVST